MDVAVTVCWHLCSFYVFCVGDIVAVRNSQYLRHGIAIIASKWCHLNAVCLAVCLCNFQRTSQGNKSFCAIKFFVFHDNLSNWEHTAVEKREKDWSNMQNILFGYKIFTITTSMLQKPAIIPVQTTSISAVHLYTFPHLICINDLHDALLEELGVNLAGDCRCLLHQAQLSVLLHRHRVRDHSADVYL